MVHQNWRPIPGRFKDYIAMPKPNLYQSLHTTVVGDQGQPFEVQIRTREMDLIAEEGIAAHWRYKEGRIEARASDPNIVWLRQLLEWQKEVQDPRTFLTTLKVDLYPDEVYVFTPKGEVFSFPRGATPLDFAYRVHTDLGHHCAGARVNGKLVPLRTVAVERRHGGGAHQPVAQPEPRLAEPGHHLARQEQDPAVAQHPAEAARHGDRPADVRQGDPQVRPLPPQGDRRAGASPPTSPARGCPSSTTSTAGSASARPSRATSSSACVGLEKLEQGPAEKPGRLRQAVSKILPFGTTAGPLTIKGHGDLLAYLAKCCNPLPGEEIVGYITRGRGSLGAPVDCPNVQNLLYNPEREIEVEWEQGKNEVYQVSLLIEVEDQQGMLARLTEAITRAGSNITAIEADTHSETGRGTDQRRLPAPRPQAARQAAARGPRHLGRAAGGPPHQRRQPDGSPQLSAAPLRSAPRSAIFTCPSGRS